MDIFTVPAMKFNIIKHIIALFFILLFSLKGIVSVLPAISAHLNKLIPTELIADSETENKKTTEEKQETGLKEYLIESPQYMITGLVYAITTRAISANNLLCQQDVFLPVYTPPPEI